MGHLINIDEAEKTIRNMFRLLPDTLTFHNWQHTQEVIERAMKIAEFCEIDDLSKDILYLAALFHDTGYVDAYGDHEERSVVIAENYLLNEGLNRSSINMITDCIRATKIPQSPEALLAEILCDADLAHFGSPNYLLYAARLRQEWSLWLPKIYSDQEWNRENLQVLREHEYKTIYGKQFFQPVKDANIIYIETSLLH
jgi:uncharacterized protein